MGPNNQVYLAKNNAELFTKALELQCSHNSDPELPEVTSTFLNIRSTTSHSPHQEKSTRLFKNSRKKSTGGSQDNKNDPQIPLENILLTPTKFSNACLRYCRFPTLWKMATIINYYSKTWRRPIKL